MDQRVPNGDAAGVPRRIVVGLVNSMPGEARRQTEQQFRAILTAAGRDAPVELRFFAFDPAPSGGGDPAAARYDDTAALESAALDGLIVTGMPPRAASFPQEPYWPAMTRLVDFARATALPTVWSCLAAHAAVFHLDGIARQPLPGKLSGLVACRRTEADHRVLQGLPWRWQVPHSRYNDVPEAALRAGGYRILSRAGEAGADIFAKDDDAPFLFCQGHPEYDAHALLREYRRDIRQYLGGEREKYPVAPENCFGVEVTAQLAAFRAQAQRQRRPETIERFPMAACMADLEHGWRDLAVGLYANWVSGIAARKSWQPAQDRRDFAATPDAGQHRLRAQAG